MLSMAVAFTRSPSAVTGLVEAGGVDEHELGAGSGEHAAHTGAGGLGLVADDADLAAAECVDQGALADVRPPDDGDESAAHVAVLQAELAIAELVVLVVVLVVLVVLVVVVVVVVVVLVVVVVQVIEVIEVIDVVVRVRRAGLIEIGHIEVGQRIQAHGGRLVWV